MRKVLVIGPKFFYFNDSIATAFRELHWEVKVVAYDSPVHPYDFCNKLSYKLSRNKKKMEMEGRRRFSQEVLSAFDAFRPSLVFVVNGAALLPDATAVMRQSSKVALWFFDSLTKYETLKENVPFADALFCYEKSDIEILRNELGVNSYFLPQAADLSRYYKIDSVEKQYDIVFAGDIWQSQKRKRILQRVVDSFPDKRILVWGVYKPWYKGVWSWLTRERRDVYMNRNTTSDVLNRCYNEARVVLNIHNEQQKDGANPKVYEIAATGACQICDANPYIESLFPESSIGLYHNDEECIRLIDEALKNPTFVTSDQARQVTMETHSFSQRITTVLAVLDML